MNETSNIAPARLPLLFARFVKIEHSVFALPFAYAGAFIALQRVPRWQVLFWLTLVMISARSLAMALNRIIDSRIDARNPRTATREIPAGQLSTDQALAFSVISLALLIFSVYHFPPLAWYLSPLVVAAFIIYPFTKRFTSLCHLFLGATIGLAPVGAWVAMTGRLPWQPWLLFGVVTLWIGGFDIIYACLDVDFDLREGLHSLPASLGISRSLWVTRVMHLLAVVLLIAAGIVFHSGIIYFVGIGIVAGLLAYENSIVSATDLSRVNTAFMTMNGIISVVYIFFLTLDLIVR